MLITPLTSHLGLLSIFSCYERISRHVCLRFLWLISQRRRAVRERGNWTLVWCLLLWNGKLSVMSAAFLTQAVLLHLGIMIDSGRFPLCSFSSRYFFSFVSFFFQSTHLFAWMFKRGIITKAVNKLCVFHVQTIWSHKYICIETVFVPRVKHSQDSGLTEMATAGAQRIINNYIVNVQNGV